jgi:protein SCO1/2
MMKKYLALLPYLLCAVFVYGGWAWHAGTERVATSAAPPPIVGFRQVTVGGPFSLVDQHGKTVTDQNYRGKYMMVFFGFTRCPDICPTTLSVLDAAFDKIGAKADAIVPLFITVDPSRDTSEELKAYLDAFGPRFVGLTGSEAQIAAAAKAYRVYYKKVPIEGGDYTFSHTSVIYLMDPEGKFVASYTLDQGPDAIAKDLDKRIQKQS